MEIILLPLLGIAVTYIGYGPFSWKKNPTAGVGFVLAGFLFRLIGPLLLVVAGMLWIFVISMAARGGRKANDVHHPTLFANGGYANMTGRFDEQSAASKNRGPFVALPDI